MTKRNGTLGTSTCMTNNFYWSLNPHHVAGDAGGLLEVDWKTLNHRKIELLKRLQPHPTVFKERDSKICITKGTFPEDHCVRMATLLNMSKINVLP
ncbi:hypothetical protein PENTCL1PPCAC_18720 [Pristionchus entomophagus]|uniref:Uncharacterized protein n=1 Tax=Pristionchus entomophagus TaxID=358040 RepID=A0AAV5TQ07_9BILA|nr:hypothetical protein PENTCL1PPCAC_18720 [Pristionchus entomophagus]